MIIYLILIILCLLCHYLFFKRKKNITFFLLTFLIFIVSAVRYNVGTDYIHYSKIYFWIINNYNIYVEIGYKYFNELIYFIKETLKIDNIQDIQKYNSKERDEILRELKNIKGCTHKQLSRVLGLNIRVIQRALSKYDNM